MKKLLVPIDGSSHSLHAVKIAGELAYCSGMEICLLNVQKKELPFEEIMYVNNNKNLEQYKIELGKDVLRKAEEILAGKKYTKEVRLGNPIDEIINYALEINANFIVMGSHGYTGLTSYFLGSVSTKVLTHSPIPVVITRDPETITKYPQKHPYLP